MNPPFLSVFWCLGGSLLAKALFDEVLEGLESIHNTGLAHMDLKPATGRMAKSS